MSRKELSDINNFTCYFSCRNDPIETFNDDYGRLEVTKVTIPLCDQSISGLLCCPKTVTAENLEVISSGSNIEQFSSQDNRKAELSCLHMTKE
jgi:hypothetical protein